MHIIGRDERRRAATTAGEMFACCGKLGESGAIRIVDVCDVVANGTGVRLGGRKESTHERKGSKDCAAQWLA